MAIDKLKLHARRKRRIRKRISGDTERPRLTIFRSNKHIYAQVVDDSGASGRSVAAVSDSSKALAGELKDKNKVDRARAVGEALAKACKEKGVTQVVFDRNGYLYHGRVRALAEGAREGGLEF